MKLSSSWKAAIAKFGNLNRRLDAEEGYVILDAKKIYMGMIVCLFPSVRILVSPISRESYYFRHYDTCDYGY